MNIFLVIILFVIGYIIFYVLTNKIHIDFNSFMRKGFKKLDNTFRTLLLCWQTRKGQDLLCHKVFNAL